MEDAEYGEIQEAADAQRLTVSAWVRQVLRSARSGSRALPPTNPGADVPVPDPTLLHRIMARHGLATPDEALDFALQRAAEAALSRPDLLDLRGAGWSGDLDRMRGGGPAETSGP